MTSLHGRRVFLDRPHQSVGGNPPSGGREHSSICWRSASVLAGIGRLVSIWHVGLPEPHALWLGYLVPELALPFVIAAAHYSSR